MNARTYPVHWDIDSCFKAPTELPAPGFAAPGVEALFFENEPYAGKTTRVFAWVGIPYVAPGASCPGVVLLHGGGGTAFDEWVRLWNQRGYAAIAIDQCGCVPEQPQPIHGGVEHKRHEDGGPPGWNASFDQIGDPIEDQWQYHAVAAAMRAHSLLASRREVDAERIGATGISWGGYLTAILAGVDTRLKFAVPVYGCGFLGDNSTWLETVFPTMHADNVSRWLHRWDPSQYLRHAKCPMLWVSGTNDFAYPLDSLMRSADQPLGQSELCVRVEMPHSHADGWAPVEIGLFADEVVRNETPLPRVGVIKVSRGDPPRIMSCPVDSPRPVISADLVYTRAEGYWSDRKYNREPATIRQSSQRQYEISGEIPERATVALLSVADDRGCVATSRYWRR